MAEVYDSRHSRGMFAVLQSRFFFSLSSLRSHLNLIMIKVMVFWLPTNTISEHIACGYDIPLYRKLQHAASHKRALFAHN